MADCINPEVALAEAVVRLAIKDVLEGPPERRMIALIDIKSGCLDYWVEAACCRECYPDVLLDALHTALPRAVRS